MSPETKEALEMLSAWVLNEQRTYRDSGFEVIDEIFDSFVDKIDSLLNPPPLNPVVEELSSLSEWLHGEDNQLNPNHEDSYQRHCAFLFVLKEIDKRISHHERSSSNDTTTVSG